MTEGISKTEIQKVKCPLGHETKILLIGPAHASAELKTWGPYHRGRESSAGGTCVETSYWKRPSPMNLGIGELHITETPNKVYADFSCSVVAGETTLLVCEICGIAFIAQSEVQRLLSKLQKRIDVEPIDPHERGVNNKFSPWPIELAKPKEDTKTKENK